MEAPGERRESGRYSPGGAEEMTGWGEGIGARGGAPLTKRDLHRGLIPTCGLVLGEVTLLREEGSSQHLNS